MFLLQECFDYIKSNKLRTIIIFIVIFVLGNVIASSFLIKNTNNIITNQVKNTLTPTATIVLSDTVSDYFNIENISIEKIKQIGELDTVSDYEYSAMVDMEAPKYKTEEERETETFNGNPYLFIKGVSETNPYDLRQHNIEIIDGRFLNENELANSDHKIVISDTFAKINNLSVGSSIELERNVYDTLGMSMVVNFDNPELTYKNEYEIVGVFSVIENSTENNEVNENKLAYIPFEVANNVNKFLGEANKKLYGDEDIVVLFQTKFIIEEYERINEFVKEATNILPDEYLLYIDDSKYNEFVSPLVALESVSNFMLFVSLIITVIIICLILFITIFHRKYEIGIYIALGTKRKKIVIQLILEVVLITFGAIILSAFSSKFIATFISDILIQTQLHDAQILQDMYLNTPALNNLLEKQSFQYIENYNVVMTSEYFIMYIISYMILVIIASIIPIVYILKVSPKKLLISSD